MMYADEKISAIISRAGVIPSQAWRNGCIQELRKMKRDIALTKEQSKRIDEAGVVATPIENMIK